MNIRCSGLAWPRNCLVSLLTHSRGPMGCPGRAPRLVPSSGLSPARDLTLWPQSRKPAPQGSLHVPRDCRTDPQLPWPFSAFSHGGGGGGRDGVREGEEEGFIKENRLEKDSPTYSHSVAL